MTPPLKDPGGVSGIPQEELGSSSHHLPVSQQGNSCHQALGWRLSHLILPAFPQCPIDVPVFQMGELRLRESMLFVQGHTAGEWKSLNLSLGKSDSWGPSLGLPWKEWKMSHPWAGTWQEIVCHPRRMTPPQGSSGGSILKIIEIVTHPREELILQMGTLRLQDKE